LWFLSRSKTGNKNRDRKGEVLFIDASELGYMVNRRNRAFDEGDIQAIAGTYHNWKRLPSPSPSHREQDRTPAVPFPQGEGFRVREYQDIKGFCKSATLAEIEKHNFVLTPGRHVGIPDEVESEVSFEETMGALTSELAAQMKEAAELDAEIKIQLAKVGFKLEG